MGFFVNLSTPLSILITSCLFIIILTLHFVNSFQYKYATVFKTLILCLVFSVGLVTVNTHNQKRFKTHYSNYISKNSQDQDITFRVREVLKPGQFHSKYVIEILNVNSQYSTGKSLLNVALDSLQSPLMVDEIYSTKTEFKDLIKPLNPYQFNYKSYLSKSYIYHQIFINSKHLLLLSSNKHTIFGYADELRSLIVSKLELHDFKPNELAIIKALLLGQRQDITDTIYTSYTQAGAIHILAVSGLHVGIILILLNIVLKPLDYFKRGKHIKLIFIILLLWSYAIIAGLSASVVRAVTMFTAVAIAMHLKRPIHVFNTLAISVFVLLLFKPMFIFDVGFQLSYLAVFAIVIFQPMLENLWLPTFKIINFFWKIFTVTLAAQIGIIPISLYYFHQFPGLFFISNLVIIPCLGIILGLGILIIILALINTLPSFLSHFYGWVIDLMNTFVLWVSQQETFLFKHISFTLLQVIASYIIIVLSLVFIKRKNYSSLVILLIGVLCLQTLFITKEWTTPKNSFLVFHKSRHSIIGLKSDKTLNIQTTLKHPKSEKLLINYNIGEAIDSTSYSSFKDVYNVNNKILLVVDSLGVYNLKKTKPDYILLRHSPKINLNRLIDSLNPELIISDGSNYKSYQERWSKTCKLRGVIFHQTSVKGAFKINY